MTPKQERFCQEIVKGKTQSDAYRIAFKPKRMKQKSIHERASQVMADIKVKSRVAALLEPVVAKAVAETGLTREQWIQDGLRLYKGDVRKMFDIHGNVIDIPNLSDSEADCIEGFEIVEDFTKVKRNDGSTEAVPTGYTKKIKFTKRRDRHEYLGKALGYYTDKQEIIGRITLEALVLASMEVHKG